MEDKRTPLNIAGGILDNIFSIADKFITGLTSFGKKDISEQLDTFAETLKQIPLERRSLSKEEGEALLKIFIAAAQPSFAKQFMGEIDKEVYFSFGTFLNKQLTEGQKLETLTHEYLNLFRFSSLLRRIYTEEKWEPLIHELILKSNYNSRTLFNQRLRDYPGKTLFKVIKGNAVDEYSWEKSASLIKKYRYALYSIIEKDDKAAFLLDNCIEMALLDLACLTGGIVNVMIPGNSVTEHIRFILQQSKASILITQDEKQLSKIKSVKNELPDLKTVILLEGNSSEDWVINFDEFIRSGNETNKGFERGIDELATIMYTSGTTGEPKGIMFSQMNIIYKRFCRAMAIPEIGDEDRFISFLPLYHTFGRYLEMTGCVFWAAEYCFLENPSVEAMISNMQLVKPTVFISIPKKWMQLYEYITSKVDIEVDEHQKIKNELDKATGGNLKWGLSAAGYLPPDIFQFFQKYGVELMSGFGMTEATGGITMTPWKQYKPNSLGKALPGIEIKIGEDGELLVKGPYVMPGYYDTPNSETFTADGWLPTGDVMKMDEDGSIQIIDRKKEIYKNIKGETIAPQKIENLFRDFETVKQVFLVGDHRQFNTVLIYPNFEDENSLLNSMEEKQIQDYFSSVIVTVNKFLPPFERILDYRLIDRAFDDKYGELTPKHTYKRKVIEKNFSELIESMYVSNQTIVYSNKTEVRIPNWFLREKGCLSRDILASSDSITIPKLKLSLKLSRQADDKVYRIGSYNYKINSHYIDFQSFLIDPLLWIGNKELIDFTGRSIIQWYRQIKESNQIQFHSQASKTTLTEQDKNQFVKICSASEFSLQGIHLAYLHLHSEEAEDRLKSLNFFRNILDDLRNQHYHLVFNLLAKSGFLTDTVTRKSVFIELLKRADDKKFGEIFSSFVSSDKNFLDQELIQTIAVNSKGKDRLAFIENLINNELERLRESEKPATALIDNLIRLITALGITHPQLFRRVRRFLLRLGLMQASEFIIEATRECFDTLHHGLREWLGTNQQIAIDAETGEEYGWEDVLTFEEGTDPDDRLRIKNSILKTSVLREAVFLFSKGIQLRLDDILPGGVWISLLESRNDKSIYRISVQTRFKGTFDLTIHLNRNLPPAIVREEIKWLIIAGTNSKNERLLPRFGGYWEEYELWTESFVPRDSIAKFFERETKRLDDETKQRLRSLWPHFVWNSSSAYMNFWVITNYEIQLTNPMPGNITVPTHDYQTGTLLYSVSKRIKSKSPKEFFITFYNLFVKATLDNYSFLSKKSIWNYIFSGVTECVGEKKAVELIQDFINEVSTDQSVAEKEEIIFRANEFIKSITSEGFIPRSLFFAIKRFHRWKEVNLEADTTAQAEMLYELYETYRLFGLEKEFRHARSFFFLRTAFNNSHQELKNALGMIASKQRAGELSLEQSQKLYSELYTISHLTEDDRFFLTRLNYPYLKPKDEAALIRAESYEGGLSNLVVQLNDEDGNIFFIRNPASPKEISRLQALFLESNLVVNFRPEHKFLVALSERGFIIGGLFFERTDEQTAHMEKIVVSSRYRRKGISEALMNELFSRLKAEHLNHVTTGYFRPEYFYKFGFRVEKKYPGLVLDLQKFSSKQQPDFS